jgi:hypothetical protein
MAQTFKSVSIVVSTAEAQLYQCPAGKSAIVTASAFTNVTGAGVNMDLIFRFHNGGSPQDRRLIDDISLTSKATWSFSDMGKLVLNAQDSLRASCTASNAVDAILSILELDL